MLEAARLGARWTAIAAIGGISTPALSDLLKADDTAADWRVKLRVALIKTRAQSQAALLKSLRDLADAGDFKSITWILERVYGFTAGAADPDAPETQAAAKSELITALKTALEGLEGVPVGGHNA